MVAPPGPSRETVVALLTVAVGLQNRVSGAKDLDMIMPQPCGTRG